MQPAALTPHDIKERSSVAVSFFVRVPAGIGLAEATSPAYWRNAWKVLEHRILSTIDLVAEDGEWEASVRVLQATPTVMKFRVLSQWQPDAKDAARKAPDGVKVEFITEAGWRALFGDGTVIADAMPAIVGANLGEADGLADQVLAKLQKLVAARPTPAPAVALELPR